MTIIEQIKAEIEDALHILGSGYSEIEMGQISAYGHILSFLSDLESEKPMVQEELSDEISHISERYPEVSFAKLSRIAVHFAKWGAEHLATSGKTSSDDLEEAAINHSNSWYCSALKELNETGTGCDGITDAFITGAKWQAEQLLKSSPLPEDTVLFNKGVEEGKRLMMEEAVKGEVMLNPYPTICLDDCKDYDFKDGDKVRVIVLPKED